MARLRFVVRRVLLLIPTLLVITFVTFLMLRSAPGDPARVIAGPRASDEVIQQIREQLGLNQPILVQYVHYLDRVLHGDFGANLTGSQDVSQVISASVPVTGLLVLGAALLTMVIATPLAILAARRPGGLTDSSIRALSIAGVAIPIFWLGLMLITYVALPTGWFPVGGWPDSARGRFFALVLPSLTLALSMAPIVMRSLRSSLIDVWGSDYVKAARAMGLSRGRVTRRFVARNATVPSVPVLAIVVGLLLGGTVITEYTFNLPGAGSALVQAAQQRDANVVQGLTLVMGVTVALVYLIADIILSLLDPRVRIE